MLFRSLTRARGGFRHEVGIIMFAHFVKPAFSSLSLVQPGAVTEWGLPPHSALLVIHHSVLPTVFALQRFTAADSRTTGEILNWPLPTFRPTPDGPGIKLV